jgi:hypothetical protein
MNETFILTMEFDYVSLNYVPYDPTAQLPNERVKNMLHW